MRTTTTVALAAGAAGLALLTGGAAAAWVPMESRTVSQVVTAVTGEDAPEVLAFNRDEERMARDLYTLFAETYDTGPFAHIAASEQRHFDAVGRLLAAYGIDDPSKGREAGDYPDAQIQKLYDEWKAQGLTSLEAAYQVGIDLENRDIADLEASLAEVTQDDVTTVLSHLLAASRMHLRAFTAAAEGSSAGGAGSGMGPGRGMHWGSGPRWSDDDSTNGGGPGRGRGGRGGGGRGTGTGSCPQTW